MTEWVWKSSKNRTDTEGVEPPRV